MPINLHVFLLSHSEPTTRLEIQNLSKRILQIHCPSKNENDIFCQPVCQMIQPKIMSPKITGYFMGTKITSECSREKMRIFLGKNRSIFPAIRLSKKEKLHPTNDRLLMIVKWSSFEDERKKCHSSWNLRAEGRINFARVSVFLRPVSGDYKMFTTMGIAKFTSSADIYWKYKRSRS